MTNAKFPAVEGAPAVCPAHAGKDHPKIRPAKVGVLIANLGTPDSTDYWPMRRYLSEFQIGRAHV